MEITIKSCQFHEYTDYLEENGIPRSIGCPFALVSVAMLEDIIGEQFIIDRIDSEDGVCKIILGNHEKSNSKDDYSESFVFRK